MVDLRPEEIVNKDLVGWLGGAPVYRISTVGGFELVLVLRNGRLEDLGHGPHRGVARSAAKKREPSIEWNELAKSDIQVDENGPLVQKWYAFTDHVRALRGFKNGK